MARRPDDLELAEKLKAARARVARRSSTSAPQAKSPKTVPDEAQESASPAARAAHKEAPAGPSIRRYLDDLLEGRPTGDPSAGSGESRFERWLTAIRGG